MKRLTVLVVVLSFAACDTGTDPIPTEPPPGFWTGPSDFPGPLRVEPAGGAATVSMDELPLGVADSEPFRTFTDGIGDIGEGAPGWLDITTIDVAYQGSAVLIGFNLADDLQVPIQGRVLYGVVADVDVDGTADIRFGTANTSDTEHVQWLTDFATGHTAHSDQFDHAIAEIAFPSQHDRPVGGWIHLPILEKYEEFRFYLWASQMVNEGVVAIDFAPDEGWIDRP